MIKSSTVFRFYICFNTDAPTNVAIADRLNSMAARGQDEACVICMSYDPSTIILGSSQNKKDFDLRRAQEDGIKVVKRLTGGTGVYTTPDDFLYHISIGRKCFHDDVIKYIRVLCYLNDVFIGVLNRLGTTATQAKFIPHSATRHCDCFATSDKCELITKDRKIHGSAYKFNGAVYWQEGAIPVVPEYRKIRKYYTKQHTGRHTLPISIQEVLGPSYTKEDILQALVDELKDRFTVIIDTIPEDVIQSAQELKTRYEVC